MTTHPIVALLLADESAALGFVYLGLIFVAYFAYYGFLRQGMRPRTVVTSLDERQITEVFIAKVAGMGWHVTDWCSENPDGRLIAESSLLAGIRQQIGLTISADPHRPGKLVVRVMVLRYSKKLFGGPTKAHTLRMRLSGFASGIKRLDPAATCAVGNAVPTPASCPAPQAPTMPSTPVTRIITPVGAVMPTPAPAAVAVAVAHAWPGMPATLPSIASMPAWPPAMSAKVAMPAAPMRAAQPVMGGLKGSLLAGHGGR